MKKVIFVLIACLVLGVSGCNDNTGPQEVVQSAGANLTKGDFKGFMSLLSGDAQSTYGNQASAQSLQQKLGAVQLKVESPQLLYGNDTQESYTVDVSSVSTQAVVLTATVECELSETTCLYGTTVIVDCTPEQVKSCSIDSIQLASDPTSK